jgi:hypothetical protein
MPAFPAVPVLLFRYGTLFLSPVVATSPAPFWMDWGTVCFVLTTLIVMVLLSANIRVVAQLIILGITFLRTIMEVVPATLTVVTFR